MGGAHWRRLRAISTGVRTSAFTSRASPARTEKRPPSFLIDAILREAGFVTGLIGTIEYRLAGERSDAANTTPESLDIMQFAAELEKRGGSHLVSEISSHALALGRVYGFHFHTAVFTNLTRDHLDFHRHDGRISGGEAAAILAGGYACAGMGGAESRRCGECGDGE